MSCPPRSFFEKLIASGSAILRPPPPLRERVGVRGNIICRAGFARVFTCGSPHRGRVSFSCPAKRKKPKRRPPGRIAAQTSRGFFASQSCFARNQGAPSLAHPLGGGNLPPAPV